MPKRLDLTHRSAEPQGLLDRILSTPHLDRIVPKLQPEIIHRLIERCGLEDSSEFVALATPEQLERVFDLDLWHAGRPGHDERFDADRFGVWLEVLVEAFNLFDRVNYSEANNVFGPGAFPEQPQRDGAGRVTYGRFVKAYPPLQVQVAARLSF